MTNLQSWRNSMSIYSTTYSYLKKVNAGDQNIEKLKQDWGKEMLERLNIDTQIQGVVSSSRSLLLLGNHISYLDIPLLMAYVPSLSFVSKAEIQSWPLIGAGAKKIETVFVKRENLSSRMLARLSIQEALLAGKRVALFPSGTTCVSESKPWRIGPFKIATATGCLVQPFRISYSEMRKAAYIENDFFPTHLLKICGGKKMTAKLEFHEPVRITNPMEDCDKWYNWSKARSWDTQTEG